MKKYYYYLLLNSYYSSTSINHYFSAMNLFFPIFNEELLSDTRLSQLPTGSVLLHIEDWLAGVQRSSRRKKTLKIKNKPILAKEGQKLNSFLLTTNTQRLTTRKAKYKPDTNPIQTHSNPFAKGSNQKKYINCRASLQLQLLRNAQHPIVNEKHSKPDSKRRLFDKLSFCVIVYSGLGGRCKRICAEKS
jgi:hypothetical protein